MVCMRHGFLKGEMIMSAIKMTKHDLIPSDISACEGALDTLLGTFSEATGCYSYL